MMHKKFQNVISVLFLFAFVAMIPACTQLTANQTGEVTLNINAREADSADPSLAAVTQKKLTVTVQGDYNTTKTIDFADKAQVTFKRIPVGAKISVQADLFINDQKSYTGTSNSFVVKGRKNSVQLVLKRIQAEGQEEQEEPEEPVERNLLKVNPALGETIQGAIAKIKEINDSAEDYVIEVTGAADEYNIVIDETVPAHSITLRGAEPQSSENQEHNGIARNTKPSEGSSVLRVSGQISVVIKNFEFNVETYGIEGDGAVINVSNGATVTLENGALLAGKGSVVSGEQGQQVEISSNGVVAVEDGGLLMMKKGSTICNFQIKRGAVYVKNGGTFIMDGGTIAGISTFGSGGGAFVKSKGTFRMSGGDITGNHSVVEQSGSSETTPEAACGGGVCLEASGQDIASFTMTGGTIGHNTAETSGNGIGFLGNPDSGVTSAITIGGSAVISSNNDIYLPDYMMIDVASELTAAGEEGAAPTITPASYTRTTPLFTEETLQNDELKTQVVKFDVTADESTGTTFELSENGYMGKENQQYSVGDVLLNDGAFIPYENIAYLTSQQKSNVVGIVCELDGSHEPKSVLGLENSATQKYCWCPSENTTGNNALISSISCTVTDSNATLPNYPINSESLILGGDTDGSDNWAYICALDPTGAADAQTNYPAFNYANTYSTTAISNTPYADGWYIPSIVELSEIYKNKTIINNALSQISGAVALENTDYMSSSQHPTSEGGFWEVDMSTGNIKPNYKPSAISVCCIRTANPLPDYIVLFAASGGPGIAMQKVQSGSKAQEPISAITDYSVDNWYTDRSYTTPFSFDTSITNHTILYGKWTHNTPALTIMPSNTEGTAGSSATYALFGEWPQTIKEDDVTIDESSRFMIGDFDCYAGSDGCIYVKCTETVAFYKTYTYSNGTSVIGDGSMQAQVRYFKVEPIKWRVVTTDYNGTGNALLVAENVLTGGIPYYNGDDTRTINEATVYKNNYKYSTIRAYLNGAYESEDTQTKTYEGNGFLQKAFDLQSQTLIAVTNVDNSAASTADTGGERSESEYYCANTNDKIFLLSLNESTRAGYGFGGYADVSDSRIRMAVDYSQANSAFNETSETGAMFYLRSPQYHQPSCACAAAEGKASFSAETYREDYGIVPALTIALP